MCFDDNVTFFKAVNWAFVAIHFCFLLACVLTVELRSTPMKVFYQLITTHDQVIDIYPIYISLFTHVAGLLFHFFFALGGKSIVDGYFSYNYTNPIRFFLQFFVDGSALVGLMCIHGFRGLDSVVMVLVMFASTLGFCYFQDQYLNVNGGFNPDKEPHTFAIPIYLFMVFIIVAKSSEHINDEASIRIAIVTLVSLFQTLIMFILQRVHIRYRYVADDEQTDQESESEDTVEKGDLGNVLERGEKIDMILDEIRRGIRFEALYYLNSVFFQMTITWIAISITRTDQVLK